MSDLAGVLSFDKSNRQILYNLGGGLKYLIKTTDAPAVSDPAQTENMAQRRNMEDARSERDRQKSTMADMRTIATAWESHNIDLKTFTVDGVTDGEVSYSQIAGALLPTYIRKLPRDDGWGSSFILSVTQSGRGYSIRSYGANRRYDETPPGGTASREADIVFSDGSFVSYPEGDQRWMSQ